MHGKIYAIHTTPSPKAPLHPYCRCVIVTMRCITPGGASHEGTNGADWWIAHYGMLPLYYLSKADYMKLGWNRGKAPATYATGKMMTCGTYYNTNGHLPSAPGRVWFEADLNYYQGKRNSHRLLWSNDGLIFVTYDHYKTFIEVK